MMRVVAGAVLRLYPKVWRERYGEEVADLVASRPVRLRTVADLAAGAADAWLHRRRIPGARPLRVPLTAVLAAGVYALWLLWDPAVRQASGLRFTWEHAAQAGWLFRTATWCFVAAGAMALLAPWQLGIAARAAGKRAPYGVAARATGRRVLLTALVVAFPIGLVLLLYVSLALGWGHPITALGDAMAGGFFVPALMALVLPLPLAAAASPLMAGAARAAGKSLAVAAMLNAIGWLAVAGLMAVGARDGSPWHVAAVAACALISSGLTALVARTALKRAPHDQGLPEHTVLGPVRI
ncbi:hypothetical protein HD597_007739 [Nonomuraea thailandensis]|uniref:Uncharacterized protein n=1 Tax=Nonomuraea thailandensis TaxID=1188745 RepID=A0A9X2GK89_9ACTN|nr:hypothetical protein [Nonomuraea thailandensis]MCP2360719.1 hypothetical protein [Nonomuraea thailandensis]